MTKSKHYVENYETSQEKLFNMHTRLGSQHYDMPSSIIIRAVLYAEQKLPSRIKILCEKSFVSFCSYSTRH